MAFCTKCGAEVTGSFCSKCGTPAAAAAGEAGAPPPRRGMHPVAIVLLVLVGIIVLGITALVGTGWYLARHGGVALAKMIARANPNVEVLRTDDGAGTITLRDRRNGKEVTLTLDDVRRNGVRLLAEDNGKSASVQIGGDAKLPGWVPVYPGGRVEPVVAASGESGEGQAEGGNFTVNTGDDSDKVMAFYEDQAQRLGMRVDAKERHRERTVVVAKDEDGRRELTIVVEPHFGGTTANVTYKRER